MFSEKQLKNLNTALLELRDTSHRLTEEELEDLLTTVKIERYRMQYNNFVAFLTDMYQDYIGKPTAYREGFYDYDWTIHFGDKSVKIHNDMRIFEALYDALMQYTKDI